MKKTILSGIAGGSASGKTSISAQLKEHYEDTNSVVIIRQDDYYKDQSEKTMEERVKTNYDHPFAFDNELLVAQLQRLLQRQPICKPTYDFVPHTRSAVIEEIEPSDVVVIEGLFVLENEDLRNLCDIKIFVDTDADIRFIRRLLRDVNCLLYTSPEQSEVWCCSVIRRCSCMRCAWRTAMCVGVHCRKK